MKRTAQLALLAATLAGISQAGASDEPPPAATLVIVVGAGSAVNDIARTDLKRVFLGEPIGSLVPFNMTPSATERTVFERLALGMSGDEVGRYWVDRKIRGQGQAPRTLPTPLHVQKVVAKFPGAISYVTADKLTSELKALKVDGKAYTDAGYPLTMH